MIYASVYEGRELPVCIYTVYICMRVDACVKTHSVVEGEECSVAMLPCLLSCCSLGEDGSESVISSISSWDDWDLVFFLLNACLKELRNCKTNDKQRYRSEDGQYRRTPPTSKITSRDEFSGDITSCQIRKSLCCFQAMVTGLV